jgi:hypothetical protein
LRKFADSSNGSGEVKKALWLAKDIDVIQIVEFLSDISELAEEPLFGSSVYHMWHQRACGRTKIWFREPSFKQK